MTITHASVGAITKIMRVSRLHRHAYGWQWKWACDWTMTQRLFDFTADDLNKGEVTGKNGYKMNLWNSDRRWWAYRHYDNTGENHPLIRRLTKQALPTCPECAMYLDTAFQIRDSA